MLPNTSDRISPQTFKNGEVHDWYRIVLGYSDHLVSNLITRFGLTAGAKILDPFSGAGTTAVECMKLGIDCWAIDANPSSYFASRVKTNWGGRSGDLIAHAFQVAESYAGIRRTTTVLRKNPSYLYLKNSGMIERNWILESRLLDVIAIKIAICDCTAKRTIKQALLLALMHQLVARASNVRFGPELYCGKPREGVIVIEDFLAQIASMEDDLNIARSCERGRARVFLRDARKLCASSISAPNAGFDAIITSPPYPTEHDYTRNSRLELALLEDVIDRSSLQKIKKQMVRSHTKGIYSTDSDESEVSGLCSLKPIVDEIEKRASSKSYGFARLYGKVTREYFGGMRRHFRSVFPLLRSGALCAYVVGDQCSYFQVEIPTAQLLGEIACAEGFSLEGIHIWRERWATATKKMVIERILIIRKP